MPHRMKAFVHRAELDAGGYPEGCPLDSSRAGKTRDTLRSMGLLDGEDRVEVAPEPLSRAAVERFHTPEYVDALQRAGWGELKPHEALRFGLGTPDCPIFKNMFEYVALAAGGSVTGARLLLEGKSDIAFNPSGGLHHAQAGNAAGFCYLNDIVLAALEMTDAGKRVLFLDIDAHHCDGVQDAFYDRKDVMTISLHESGRTLFPGTGFEDEIGTGEGKGYTVNIPLPVGTYDAAYKKAFKDAALPLIKAYDADMIVLEIGTDALAGDPLAHLHLTNNVHADITQAIVDLKKPILATGGGGYNSENAVRGWALCWSVLCGDQKVQRDLMLGMGGVMLENTDWLGGLRDRVLLADGGLRDAIDAEINLVIDRIRSRVFPIHGL